MVTRQLAPIVIAALVGAAPADSAAAPDGTTVTGVVELADLASRPERPVRSRGFVRRVRGPLKPPQKADPRDQMVVVLEGGPVHEDDKKPPSGTQRYVLVGESFASPVFPFVAGADVEIKNAGHASPRLHAPGRAELIDEAPLSPKGVRPIREKLTEPLAAVEIRDRDSAHIRGQLLPMPHSYFSLVGEDGKYEIEGVPAGEWRVRLWYRGGFVQLSKPVTVEVSGRSSKAPTIKLPPSPKSAPPADSEGK